MVVSSSYNYIYNFQVLSRTLQIELMIISEFYFSIQDPVCNKLLSVDLYRLQNINKNKIFQNSQQCEKLKNGKLLSDCKIKSSSH